MEKTISGTVEKQANDQERIKAHKVQQESRQGGG
jgi:hypothetical protein